MRIFCFEKFNPQIEWEETELHGIRLFVDSTFCGFIVQRNKPDSQGHACSFGGTYYKSMMIEVVVYGSGHECKGLFLYKETKDYSMLKKTTK